MVEILTHACAFIAGGLIMSKAMIYSDIKVLKESVRSRSAAASMAAQKVVDAFGLMAEEHGRLSNIVRDLARRAAEAPGDGMSEETEVALQNFIEELEESDRRVKLLNEHIQEFPRVLEIKI